MQVQIVLVHIYMATTITFVIHIVMKGKSPPSIMCTTTTNNISYELKHDNDIINMKMLHKHKCTSPNKPYFTPSQSFMSKREDRETSTTKTELRLLPPLRHLRQVFLRHLRLWMLCHLRPSSTTRAMMCHLRPSSMATMMRWLSMGFSLRPRRRMMT